MFVIKFYDTNALLILQEKILEEPFCISAVSLKELEDIKTSSKKDEKTKYRARNIVRILNDNYSKYEVIVPQKWDKTPDELICECASTVDDVVFITNDLCCRAIAKHIYNLKSLPITDVEENIYKGYKTIRGNTNIINITMENIDYSEWNINEYLIIENTDDNSVKEMRFDGSGFVALKLPPSKYIKAKNSLQRCALDMLMNQDIEIVAILGGYGSGKSFITMRMALYNVKEKGFQSKILGVREPQGEGAQIGYLPGEFDSKTELFFAPLMQQLDGGEFEFEHLKQQGMFEFNIPYYLKGTTYNDTIILVDEAEDLTDKQIKLIGTRIGNNSKIYLSGDYKQSVVNASDSNSLIKMCNAFKGNNKFACIYLGEDVRSEASRMFAEL